MLTTADLQPFWQLRERLSLVDGFVIYGAQRLFIPTSLRRLVLQVLHSAHPGQVRALQRARTCVFWPGITNDIINTVNNCEACGLNQVSQRKEPLQLEPTAARPGEKIVSDIFTYESKDYLVIADRYSGWADITPYKKSGVTASNMIDAIISWCKFMGVPDSRKKYE